MFSIAVCDNDRLDLSLILQSVESWIKQHKNIDWKVTQFLQADELIDTIKESILISIY